MTNIVLGDPLCNGVDSMAFPLSGPVTSPSCRARETSSGASPRGTRQRVGRSPAGHRRSPQSLEPPRCSSARGAAWLEVAAVSRCQLAGDPAEQLVRRRAPVRGHEILRLDGAQRHDVLVGSEVAHDASAAHRQQHDECLAHLVVVAPGRGTCRNHEEVPRVLRGTSMKLILPSMPPARRSWASRRRWSSRRSCHRLVARRGYRTWIDTSTFRQRAVLFLYSR